MYRGPLATGDSFYTSYSIDVLNDKVLAAGRRHDPWIICQALD